MSELESSKSSQGAEAKRVWVISVVSSLIASAVFLAFFQPIIEFLSRVVSSVLGHVASGALDSMYDQASLGSERAMLFLIVEIIMALITAFALFPFITISLLKMRRAADAEGKKIRLNLRNLLILQSVLSTFMIIGVVYMMSTSLIGIQATASFERSMAISAPHLSEQQEEEFLSEWSAMNSRSDFVALMDRLEATAKAGGWTLPKRLI